MTGTGFGYTVIVNVIGVPVHVLLLKVYIGVTVIVATLFEPVLLTATKDGIFPDPLAARPIVGSLFVQLNCTPIGVPVKLTGIVLAPLHKA